MPSSRTLAIAAALLGLLVLAGRNAPAATPALRVIVHPANGSSALDRKFLTEVFLKRTTRWGGGEAIRPVDQDVDAPVRRRFSEDVLNRSVNSVKSYWQQMIFSGRAIPPPELESDEEVLRYVARHPGAIGYVSAAADVSGVKVVTLK